MVAPVLQRRCSQGREGLERIRAAHTHMVSSRGGPSVRMVVAKAAIKVQIATACKNMPVWPTPRGRIDWLLLGCCDLSVVHMGSDW